MTPTDRLSLALSLRVDLRDDAACARLTIAAANAYLTARGWTRVDLPTWSAWRHDGAQVYVPRDERPEHGALMADVVRGIAEHEGRSPLAVYLGLADCSAALPPKTRPRLPDEQPALPGLEPPAKVRRTAQHRFGILRWETAPATELAPAHPVALATCPHCGCQRRRANTGARLGAHDTYSKDGQTWSRVSPACMVKRKG